MDDIWTCGIGYGVPLALLFLWWTTRLGFRSSQRRQDKLPLVVGVLVGVFAVPLIVYLTSWFVLFMLVATFGLFAAVCMPAYWVEEYFSAQATLLALTAVG